jgi:7-keto-8-aminopelargonate synthetase-like enzyme
LVERLTPGRNIPIATISMGDEESALNASQRFYEDGFLVPAIRPPTVPRGSSRLRISLSAAHTHEQVGALIDRLREMGLERWRH